MCREIVFEVVGLEIQIVIIDGVFFAPYQFRFALSRTNLNTVMPLRTTHRCRSHQVPVSIIILQLSPRQTPQPPATLVLCRPQTLLSQTDKFGQTTAGRRRTHRYMLSTVSPIFLYSLRLSLLRFVCLEVILLLVSVFDAGNNLLNGNALTLQFV